MKKVNLFIMLVLNAWLLSAQPYGQTQYPNGSTMTSGYRTSLHTGNDGFIMAGTKNSSTIHVDKTLSGGFIPTSITPNTFTRDYTVLQTNICGATPTTPAALMSGVCAIELAANNTYWYAMAGAYSNGCFVSFMNSTGIATNTVTFPFPSTAINANRPTIVENPNTNDLYICGSYNSDMYVIKLNGAGTVAWSYFYNAGNAVLMEPRDIILSGHTGEVIIVGHMTPTGYNSASDAFFMALNPFNGNLNSFKNYTSTPCNWFNSVKTAYCSAPGGVGYIVGGYTDYNLNNGGALMMKLGLTGTTIWNTLMTSGASGIYADEIMGVVERVNTLGQYEYYGVAETFNNNQIPQFVDMSIFKLNAAGIPGPPPNEYHYNAIASLQFRPINLSFKNTGGTDVGLHVMADNAGTGHYLLESYFNGLTGCNNDDQTIIMATEPGPNMVNMPVNRFGSLSICNKIQLQSNAVIPLFTQVCTSTSVPGGSNALILETDELSADDQLNIYPNPGNGFYTLQTDGPVTITVYNVLNEIVAENDFSGRTNQIDISNQPNGIYLVKVFDGQATKTVQVVKN